ncbi:MAG: ASPIC/UnbV domain-containing protein [Xenococcaceae cyanobacterium]
MFATAGGITQLREQSGGIHHKVQNHQRIHFGLAEHSTVDELVIEWPSGSVQKLNNIPADQLIRIIEPSGDFLPGQPDYQPGTEAGVFIWKDYFDGPYHLSTVGAADPTEFAVNLIANDPLLEVTPVKLENNDVLDVSEFGFSLNSKLVGWQDGVDFYLNPGTEAILSVTQDGVANPRQVNVGQQRSRLSPTGWIISSDELPERPAFSAGNDLGLFFGQGANDDTLEFRWSGDGNWHETSLSVLAAEETSSFSLVNLEPNDELATFSNGIEIQGQVGTWQDGLDITTTEPTKIGVTYEQDGLFQPHRVNSFDDLLGLPNAYQLPLATPYGQPEYEPSVDEGIFLWQDEEDFWHLRMTASEGGTRYVGSIVSDRAAIDVQTVKLEETDLVNTIDPLRIDFDFQVWQSGEDGIDFRFPEGAAVTLNLEQPGEEAAALLRVGAEQWPVSELPLDLSGW